MLLNDFFTYRIIEKSDDEIIATINLNKDHGIYAGHFPGMPVTPGICQVQMIQEVLKDTFSSAYSLRSARDIKFLNFINPKEVNSFDLDLTISKGDHDALTVKALMHKGEVNYLKMRSVFVTA